MPRDGFMLKDDICFVEKFSMDGNAVEIFHPGVIDQRFLERLKAFMSDFDYEYQGEWYYGSEDYTNIKFSYEGDLED